ncbi:MAG: hypothetical protein RL582_602, partial [Bacteroidota bacterium]
LYMGLIIFEFLVINISALGIFYSLLNKTNNELNYGDSILNSGFFIFINVTAPYYLINDSIFFSSEKILDTLRFINYLGYSIVFITIIKSLKWQIKN